MPESVLDPPAPFSGARLAKSWPVRSKLLAPRVDSGWIRRPAIERLAQEAAQAKLVLFRAPSGFGKTTAMRQYFDMAQAQGRAVAWLTLDALDDDFTRLLTHVVAAFNAVLNQYTDRPHGDARSAISDADRSAFDLVDRIASAPHSFAVCIDDFEAPTTRAIDELVRLILDRLPAHGQLVIASRRIPSVQVARLRARGELVDLGQSHLRFTRDETALFLRGQPDLSLVGADLTRLHGASEGWPAALWLARAALAKRSNPESFIAAFSGSYSAVADYLAEEVLSRMPDRDRYFLLRTSLVDELTPALCDTLCERCDSQKVLHRLERLHGALLIDTERRLYRYHRLFRSFLRAQLDRHARNEVPELHRRASVWFAAAGQPVPAIEHALAGGHHDAAISLLRRNVNEFLFNGRVRMLARWLGSLPEVALRNEPQLRMAHIWSLTFTHFAQDALSQLDTLEAPMESHDSAASAALLQELQARRPYILGMLDRHTEGLQLAEAALKLQWREDSFAYGLLAAAAATWRVGAGRYDDALALLRRARGSASAGPAPFPTLYAMCLEGIIELLQGRVRSAIVRFREGLAQSSTDTGGRSVG